MYGRFWGTIGTTIEFVVAAVWVGRGGARDRQQPDSTEQAGRPQAGPTVGGRHAVGWNLEVGTGHGWRRSDGGYVPRFSVSYFSFFSSRRRLCNLALCNCDGRCLKRRGGEGEGGRMSCSSGLLCVGCFFSGLLTRGSLEGGVI